MNKPGINRGANTKEHWEQKHVHEYDIDKPYDFSIYDLESSKLANHKVAADIIKANHDSVSRKSYYELGCAGGDFAAYLKTMIIPDWEVAASDFSVTGIESAKRRCPAVNFEQRDFILNPIEKDYGIIGMFEVIEHLAEGDNYMVLDNILGHCEYAIISCPSTLDDCRCEHISHYTLDTFTEKGYNVLWKSNLAKIDMSNTGDFNDYFYMIFLIKGKL